MAPLSPWNPVTSLGVSVAFQAVTTSWGRGRRSSGFVSQVFSKELSRARRGFTVEQGSRPRAVAL